MVSVVMETPMLMDHQQGEIALQSTEKSVCQDFL
jgi:hypothetical protein